MVGCASLCPPYAISPHAIARCGNSSAIWMAFSAAPFSSWSAGDEHRDRVAAGVAEVLPDAADQDVVLAGGVDRHREVVLRAVVDDLARPARSDRIARTSASVIGLSHSKVMASQWARSTGTRTQVTPTAIRSSSKILRVSLDDLGLLVVVAGLGIDRRCCG